METVKRQSNGNIILKNEKVSCGCCCPSKNTWSGNNIFEITKEEYSGFSKGGTVSINYFASSDDFIPYKNNSEYDRWEELRQNINQTKQLSLIKCYGSAFFTGTSLIRQWYRYQIEYPGIPDFQSSLYYTTFKLRIAKENGKFYAKYSFAPILNSYQGTDSTPIDSQYPQTKNLTFNNTPIFFPGYPPWYWVPNHINLFSSVSLVATFTPNP